MRTCHFAIRRLLRKAKISTTQYSEIREMQKQPATRLEWIDMAKAICMMFIIYAHTKYVPQYMGKFYTPFFLTTFFFISGYFFLNTSLRIDNLRQKLLNIVTSLFIPYILYWFISFAVDSCIHGNYFFFDDWCWHVLMGDKLWFVSALIVAELMTLLFVAIYQRFRHRCRGGVIILLILSFSIYLSLPDMNYPWYLKPAFLATFYVGLGIICRTHSGVFMKMVRSHFVGIASLCIFLGLWVLNCTLQLEDGRFPRGFRHIYLFLIQSLFSIIALLYLCRMVFRSTWLLRFIGSYSLLFYFYQNQVLNVTIWIGKRLSIDTPCMWYSAVSAVVVTLVLIVPVWITAKYIPILAGKWRINIDK